MTLDSLRADRRAFDVLAITELTSDGEITDHLSGTIVNERAGLFILETSDRYIKLRVIDGAVRGYLSVPKEYADADFMRLE